MRIWILNHYASHMQDDKGGRHYWFSKFLSKNGHQPVVFCAGKNETDSHRVSYSKEIDSYFVYVKINDERNSFFKRFHSMLSFYKNVKKVAKEYARSNGKPDIILASSVHPLTLLAGIKLAKYFGVKCICEIRDLWPEAIFAYSEIKKESIIGKLLYRGEKWLYTKADALIFTQEGGADYIRRHKWDLANGGKINMDKVFYINNGVDLQAFDENAKNYVFEDEDLDDPGLFKVVYAGAIRRVNDIGIILDAAKKIKLPNIKFLIFGDGDMLPSLKKRVEDEKIDNVVFKGRVNKQFVPSIVCRADLNLAHWKMTPLVKELGESCNKVFEYCAAGKPMLYTLHPSYSIAEKYDSGLFTDDYTADDIAKSIINCSLLPETSVQELSDNARKAAKDFDFEKLTLDLIKIINTLS